MAGVRWRASHDVSHRIPSYRIASCDMASHPMHDVASGFVKILKKHDKMSAFDATSIILPIIEQERFKASPVLEQFLLRVEVRDMCEELCSVVLCSVAFRDDMHVMVWDAMRCDAMRCDAMQCNAMQSG